MKSVRMLSTALGLGISATAFGAETLVRNQTELLSAINAAQPGDSIVLRNGVWTGMALANKLIPSGTAAQPINIRAQTPGQVVITGAGTFDVRGSHYTVSGLSFKDTNDTLKALRFRGDNARVFDNAVLNFGRYNQAQWDVQDTALNPTSSFDHNFVAGKKDRGVSLVLDLSLNAQIRNNFFGHRDRGGPSGQTNGWETIRIGVSSIMDTVLGAVVQGNYFEGTEGEQELISDKTRDNQIINNTFHNVVNVGRVTGRHGSGGVYEGNYFINALGFRVGNSDDAIPDHPGLTIRNNYLEGPNAKIILPGNQTTPTIESNTIFVSQGAYISGEGTTGKMPLEYHNTTGGVINNNVFVSDDSATAAVQAVTSNSTTPTASGAGNYAFNLRSSTVFTSGVPQPIKDVFTVSNPNLVRDGMGVYRPTGVAAGKGFTGTHAPLTRSSDVGPSWMDPVMRLNKFTAAELKFNGDLSGGAIDASAHNSGYLVGPATIKNSSGTATNLHTSVAQGVTGSLGDRAFDNRSTDFMGAPSGSATIPDRTWFRNLQAFTVTGWFKTDGAETIANNASLIEQLDGSGGWSLRAAQTGRLTLNIHDGSGSTSVTSDQAFTQHNQWAFFAVKFDQRPNSNEVEFFVGTSAADVTSAGIRSLSRTASSDAVTADLIIGKGFDGLIDNVRLFSARRNITWIDEDGASYTRTATNHDFALLSLVDLQAVRAFDLTPFEQPWAQRWNVNSNGTWADSSNWVGGSPNAQDAVANFTGAITAPRTISVDPARTVGMINFDNPNRYTLSSGSIMLDVSTGSAEINVASGSHTIGSNLILLDDTAVFVRQAASVLTINGTIWAPGKTLEKRGPGPLDFSRITAGSLSISQGVVRMLAGPGSSTVNTLTINGGQLWLTDDPLSVDYTGTSPQTPIRQMLEDGRMIAPDASSSQRLGYVDDSSVVLIKLTFAGDADLDGDVDVNDLGALASSWQSAAVWSGGDFDYNGTVDVNDLGLLAGNWQAGVSLGDALASFGLPATSIPEPGSTILTGVVFMLFARRWRGQLC